MFPRQKQLEQYGRNIYQFFILIRSTDLPEYIDVYLKRMLGRVEQLIEQFAILLCFIHIDISNILFILSYALNVLAIYLIIICLFNYFVVILTILTSHILIRHYPIR